MADQVIGKTHYSAVQFTRPNDTTTYTAGDVICNAATLVFPGAIPTGCTILNYATITSSQNAAAKPNLELWVFNTTIAAVADNAAFAPTDAEMLTLVAVVPFYSSDWKAGLSGAAGAGNSMCSASGLGIPIWSLTPAGTRDTNLYAQLVDRTGLVPIAQEVFKIRLGFLD